MTNSARDSALLDRSIVYGEVTGLVFIPRMQAERLCALWNAATTATTWAELRNLLPEVEIEEIVSLVEEFQDESWEPYGDTPFEGEELYGGDARWPDWPDQDMILWVPTPIQQSYGTEDMSFVSGSFLHFDPKFERELVSAFQANGFSVTRDDELVKRACGDSL